MLSLLRRNQTLIAALLLFFVLGALFFPSAGRDDDYIAFWSAEALLNFDALINPNGERLEQGSSIGHILLLAAAAGLTGISVPGIAIPLSVCCGLLMLIVLNQFRSFFTPPVTDFALIIAATSFPLLYWSFAGLETAAYTLALLIFCLIYLYNHHSRPGIRSLFLLAPFSLLIQALRPEAFFVTGLATGIFWLLSLRAAVAEDARRVSVGQLFSLAPTRHFMAFLAVHCGIFAALAAFRMNYFGMLFPQPVISKMTGVFPGLHAGIPVLPSSAYIGSFLLQNLVLLAGILTMVRMLPGRASHDDRQQNAVFFLAAIVFAQLTFIMLSGPDWMEGFRFIVPVIPALALLAGLFYRQLFVARPPLKRPVIALLACLQATGFGYFVVTASSSIPLWAFNNNLQTEIPTAANYPWTARANTHHIRDIPLTEALQDTVDRLLPITDNRPVIITSYQAGFVLFHVARSHFKQVRFIDLAGLVDDTLTQCPPLQEATQNIRDVAARDGQLGHMETLSFLIRNSNTAETCFTPRPDIIYLMGEVSQQAPYFAELGYEFAFNNSGDLSLEFGKDTFYGGLLVDRTLFEQAGLEFTEADLSVGLAGRL